MKPTLLLPSSVQFKLASSVELSLALIMIIKLTHHQGKYISNCKYFLKLSLVQIRRFSYIRIFAPPPPQK